MDISRLLGDLCRAFILLILDFPLVGFYANGEISHNPLYGYTGVLTLFV